MEHKQMVMVVGDEELRRFICDNIREYFEIVEAAPTQATCNSAALWINSMAALFLGIRDRDGLSLLESMDRLRLMRRVPVVIFSAEKDPVLERCAYELGAADFITVPFDADIARIKLRNLLLLFRDRDALEEESVRHLREAAVNHQNTIDFLANVIEARNMENGEHVSRVKGFTRILALQVMKDWPEYRLDEQQIELITAASALHDLGKIMIRESVLLKPGKLNEDETQYMKTHTVCGCMLLRKMKNMLFEDFYRVCYEICRWHHEKVDGSGYPDNLKDDEIPISAQIVSVADCYDALTAKRPYKEAYSADKAYEMIISGECGAFSEEMMTSFRKCRTRFKRMVVHGRTHV